MKINTVPAKNFMNKSNLTGGFTCNPYVGCMHGCIYCFAKFMLRGRDKSDIWGKFVDIKEFPNYSIPRNTGEAGLYLSTVTDCYQPLELEANATRKVLEAVKESNLKVTILTKSKHVLRDLDLFKTMKSIEIGFSIAINDELASVMEPFASKPSERLSALKTLKTKNIQTFVFIAPIIPYITDVFSIIEAAKNHADYFMFDSLNLKHPDNFKSILNYVSTYHPELKKKFEDIFLHHNHTFYDNLREEIIAYMNKENLKYKYIYD